MTDTIMADISEFQGNILAPPYLGAGFQVVICRTYNGYRPDLMMPVRRDYLRGFSFAGIGWYCYLAKNMDPATQAHAFINTIGTLRGNEWAILDHEEGTLTDETGRAQAFLNVVDAWAGFPTMIYSDTSFMNAHLGGAAHWAGRPVWLAAYQSNEPTDPHTLWQFSDAYSFPGILAPNGAMQPCDASIHHDTVQEFMASVRGGAKPPPLTNNGGNMMFSEAGGPGYWALDSIGGVFAMNGAPFLGSLPALSVHPNSPVIGGTSTPSGKGYWIVDTLGEVYAFGDAQYLGPDPTWRAAWGIGIPGNPIVGIAATTVNGGSAYALAAARPGFDPAYYAMTPDGQYARPKT